MSAQSEITRIIDARNDIRNKGVSLGIALPTDNITNVAAKFSAIVNQGAVQAEVMEGETYTIPQGFHSGSGTVTGVAGGGGYTLQAKGVTPAKAQQTVTPDDGYFALSSVTVEPIPAAYQDVSAVTAAAADVLATKIFVPASGVSTAGTMPNNGAVAASFDGLTVTSYVIPQGYHSGAGTISLTNDIELALAAI